MRRRVVVGLLALGINGCQPRSGDIASAPPAPMPPPAPGPIPEVAMPTPRSDAVSITELLRSPDRFAGREITLSGTCLGWSGPALGAPPRTRSDWQIGSQNAAVWVSGPLPSGCSGPGGGGSVRVRGLVEIDRASGEGRTIRAYLIAAQ